MSDSPSEVIAQTDIANEVRHLGHIYDLDGDSEFAAALDSLDFSDYAEYVLGERTLEILCGGVGRYRQLMQAAATLGVAEPIITSFGACAERRHRRMAYFKLCFGPGHDQATLYLNLMEPWESVFNLLDGLPAVKSAVPELRRTVAGSRMCILLAFSANEAGSLIVKTYHPAARRDAPHDAPLMASYRISDGIVSQSPKYYRSVLWDAVSHVHPHLEAAVAGMQQILPGRYRAVYGYHASGDEEVKPKLYIFRKDVRFGGDTRPGESIYAASGNVLLGLGRLDDAIAEFDDAIAYNDRDFNAWRNRALCYALLGETELAVQSAGTAKEVDPSMTFGASELFARFIADLAHLSEQLNSGPSADLYNQRGLLLFGRGLYREAKESFARAVALDEESAEAHNNLGGACISVGEFSEALDHCGTAISLNASVDATNYRLALDGLRRSAPRHSAANHEQAS